MAIDENGNAEILPRPVDEPAQARVIGFVEFLDSFNRFFDRHTASVNLLCLADYARDCSESPRDTQRARIGESRQPSLEHARVQLVGFAIEVEIGARKPRLDEGRAQRRNPAEQSIDESVLRAAQPSFVEPRGLEKTARVYITRMGRRKNQGAG